MQGAFASVIDESWGSLGERRFLLLMLIGFVGAFGFIRLSTRLMRSPRVPWWPGSVVSESGVHMHHLFFGIVLMMAAGGRASRQGRPTVPSTRCTHCCSASASASRSTSPRCGCTSTTSTGPGRAAADRRRAGRTGLDRIRPARVRAHEDRRRLVWIAGHHGDAGDVALRFRADRRRETPARARPVRHLRPVPAPVRRAAPRQAAIDLGEALRRRAPPGQAGTRRAPVPVRALTHRSKERLRDAIGGVTEEEYQAQLAAAAASSTIDPDAPKSR